MPVPRVRESPCAHFPIPTPMSLATSRLAGDGVTLTAWLLFAAAALVIGLVLQRSGKEDSGTSHPAVGRRLPQLELKPLTGGGRPISLADLDGQSR